MNNKIVHICLCGAVTDGFSYQDNLLTKYHRRLGYNVTIITSRWIFNKNGEISRTSESNYFNDDGVYIIRLENRVEEKYGNKFKHFSRITETLEEEEPDIIFIHGVQFRDIVKVRNYLKRNKHIKVFVDNHADFSNSGRNFLSKVILHDLIWRWHAKKIDPYTLRFYGVLPARVDWLVERYHLPKHKCELLVLGADDEKVEEALLSSSSNKVRNSFSIRDNDFLIVTGGKIDSAKRQTLLLMEAVKRINMEHLKLLIFGTIQKDMIALFNSYLDDKRIQYAGWASVDESYEYFGAADLVVFPGRHSVYWEQVVGMGKPMVCKYWEGTTHIDLNGNVQFLYEDSLDEIVSTLMSIVSPPGNNKIKEMTSVANSERKNEFLYSVIARKAIEIAR